VASIRWVRPAFTTEANLRCLRRSADARWSSAGTRSSTTARVAEIGQRVHQSGGKDADADFGRARDRNQENIARVGDHLREHDGGRIAGERSPVSGEVG